MERTTQSIAIKPRTLDIALLILVIILAAPSNADATTPKPKPCLETYEVQPKDTFAMIARIRRKQLHKRYKLFGPTGMVQKMISLNKSKLTDPNVIPPGITLELPREMSPAGKHFACAAPQAPKREVASVPAAQGEVELISRETPPTAPAAQPEVHPATEVTPAAVTKAEITEGTEPDAPHSFPSRMQLTLGVAGLGSDQTVRFPNGNVELLVMPTSMLGLRANVEGFMQTYNDGTSPIYTALEGAAQGVVELRFLRYLNAGLGYRYYLFGNPFPTGVGMATHNAVATLGVEFEPFKRFQFRMSGDLRYAISMVPGGSDTYAFLPQLAGFGVLGELRMLLSKNVYAGPYYFFDSTRLSYTQTNATLGYSIASTFNAPVYGAGIQLGFGF